MKVYSKLEQQAINRAARLVVNQSRYQVWWENYDNGDGMYEYADRMTDEATEEFLQGRPIISDDNMFELATDIGLGSLFGCNDSWVDQVADYIQKHQEDCQGLWQHLCDNAIG